MPEPAIVAPPRSSSLAVRAVRLIPGILLLAAVGLAGKFVERGVDGLSAAYHLGLPTGEYIIWTILIGLSISNSVGIPAIFRPGVATYEFWLKLGIVFLGVRFVFADLVNLGGLSLILVIFEVAFSLVFMTLLGRRFRLRPKLISLLAIGSAICGVSAILATAGPIGADDEETSWAITVILALGVLSLIVFPLIGHFLHLGNRTYGLWAGLAVDNTAEAAAAGAIYSDAAGKIAVLAKTCRNAMLGFAVLGYAVYWSSRGEAKQVSNKALFLWQKFPKFILGFIVLSLLASFGAFNPAQSRSIGNLARWAFLLAFAGVGFRTRLRHLGDHGVRPFIVGLAGEIAIAIVTLGLVLGATRLSAHSF